MTPAATGKGNMDNDTYFIQRCDMLAKDAAAKGEAPVGALIVRDNEIASEAFEASRNKKDVTCHAELEAIRLAVKRLGTNDLSDCILYSTHEPCVMCSYAIRFYRIRKVVFRHAVAYFGGISSAMPLLLVKEVPPHWGDVPVIVHL